MIRSRCMQIHNYNYYNDIGVLDGNVITINLFCSVNLPLIKLAAIPCIVHKIII